MKRNDLKKRLPDFLIVGAAKCGTTSLVNYLEEHSEIYICENKEPKYLTYDLLKNKYAGPGDEKSTKSRAVKSLDEYYSIFSKAKPNQITGEASVDSIYYYKEVIPKIKKIIGDPPIIIMLRNPVKRAISAYSHLIRENRETLDFEKGLEMEGERLKSGYEFIWGYLSAGYYYESVKAYYEAFTNVKVVIFEDFIKDTQEEVYEVLDFLNIKSKHNFSKESFNVSGKPKNHLVNQFLIGDSKFKLFLKRILGKKRAVSLKNKIQKRNLEKISIKKELEIELFKNFETDIKNLEKLLNRDLAIWNAPQKNSI